MSLQSIARRELTEEEKNPTGVRKREVQKSEDRVVQLIEERKSTGIDLTDPAIREEGRSHIRSDQEVFN